MTDPMANPGRRLYEKLRALKRARRQVLVRRGVTVVSRDATILQFPKKEDDA
jgi:hypothetical protein